MPARTGKIARLPAELREQINRQLHDGRPAAEILAWLNTNTVAAQILGTFFDGRPINAQNLSEWRSGGYRDWLNQKDRHHKRLERIRELSAMSMKLAEANGGNLSEGASSILGGAILEVLEQLDDLQELSAEGEPAQADGEKTKARLQVVAEAIDDLSTAVARLRRGDHDREILRQNEERLRHAQAELDLARQKFQRDTAGIALKVLADDRARQIEAAPGSQAEKLEAMGRHLFGELWKPA